MYRKYVYTYVDKLQVMYRKYVYTYVDKLQVMYRKYVVNALSSIQSPTVYLLSLPHLVQTMPKTSEQPPGIRKSLL